MSSGTTIIRQLLANDGPLVALVPAARIMAGVLPQGTALPAVSITTVSKVDRNLPNPGTYRHVSERVQATVLASTYESQEAVIAALRKAAADKFPTVSGLVNVTVHTESAGPDFMDEEASIYLGVQDFKTTYSELR